MQFVKPDINIDFIGKKKLAFLISVTMILISLIVLVINKGPRYGIDFAGGTLIQVKFQTTTNNQSIKSSLSTIDLGKSTVQRFGEQAQNEYLIRTDKSVKTFDDLANKVKNALQTGAKRDVQIRRIEMVGPQVGKDLREKALFAMFYALLFITIYISGRFELKWVQSGIVAGSLAVAVYGSSLLNISIPLLMFIALFVTIILFWLLELKYAMGAIVALIHDVIITVGIFSIFDKEFTLPIIAALLTIIGYSLNDTIIVFDRIRENYRKHSKKPVEFIINRSINETLSRTILTTLTTLIVVISLFVLGGGIIHDFAFALIVGVLVGTYSSVFVASPILLAWQKHRN
jgi:preprotein translocase subunit SecF